MIQDSYTIRWVLHFILLLFLFCVIFLCYSFLHCYTIRSSVWCTFPQLRISGYIEKRQFNVKRDEDLIMHGITAFGCCVCLFISIVYMCVVDFDFAAQFCCFVSFIFTSFSRSVRHSAAHTVLSVEVQMRRQTTGSLLLQIQFSYFKRVQSRLLDVTYILLGAILQFFTYVFIPLYPSRYFECDPLLFVERFFVLKYFGDLFLLLSAPIRYTISILRIDRLNSVLHAECGPLLHKSNHSRVQSRKKKKKRTILGCFFVLYAVCLYIFVRLALPNSEIFAFSSHFNFHTTFSIIW